MKSMYYRIKLMRTIIMKVSMEKLQWSYVMAVEKSMRKICQFRADNIADHDKLNTSA